MQNVCKVLFQLLTEQTADGLVSYQRVTTVCADANFPIFPVLGVF